MYKDLNRCATRALLYAAIAFIYSFDMENSVSGTWRPAALCSAQMFATLHNRYAKVYLTKDGVGKSDSDERGTKLDGKAERRKRKEQRTKNKEQSVKNKD